LVEGIRPALPLGALVLVLVLVLVLGFEPAGPEPKRCPWLWVGFDLGFLSAEEGSEKQLPILLSLRLRGEGEIEFEVDVEV
jgi:hypothetical protein